MEIKLSLVGLLTEYRILPCEQDLHVSEQFVVAPKNVFVKIEKRF